MKYFTPHVYSFPTETSFIAVLEMKGVYIWYSKTFVVYINH